MSKSSNGLSAYLAVRVEAVRAEGYEVTLRRNADPPRCVIRHPNGMIVETAGASIDSAVLQALTQLRRHLAERSP